MIVESRGKYVFGGNRGTFKLNFDRSMSNLLILLPVQVADSNSLLLPFHIYTIRYYLGHLGPRDPLQITIISSMSSTTKPSIG
jgi:hypothetical protein